MTLRRVEENSSHTTSEAPKRCPFCLSARVDVFHSVGAPFYVSCRQCDCDGPLADNEASAVRLWNTANRPDEEQSK